MSSILFANGASSTLATGISSGATTLNVAAGTGAVFPQPVEGTYFRATIFPATGSTPSPEIVNVLAVSGDTFTISRGQEGSTPSSWGAGSLISNLITAGEMSLLPQIPTVSTNPNGIFPGIAGGSNVAPSMAYCLADSLVYYCVSSGDASTAIWRAFAPEDSPTFTGNPQSPTPISSDSSNKIATTGFVNAFATAYLAAKNGNPANLFNVANALNPNNATALGQFNLSITGTQGGLSIPTGSGNFIINFGEYNGTTGNTSYSGVYETPTINLTWEIPFQNGCSGGVAQAYDVPGSGLQETGWLGGASLTKTTGTALLACKQANTGMYGFYIVLGQ